MTRTLRTCAFALSLACIADLSAADPPVQAGSELLLLADGPGKGVQGTPHVACGQEAYLVVWREGWHGKGGKARIFVTRVSAQGQVLDPQGIEVAPCAAGVQERPRVAFGGGQFLVVWQDLRNGKDYDILGARISTAGKVLDSQPLSIAASPRTQVLPDVASDGQRFLVVWQGLEGEETAYRGFAVPIEPDGRLGTTVETGAAPQPKIASGGSVHLVAYGAQTVFTVMLDRDGRPLNATRYGNPAIRSTKDATFSLSAVPGRGWLVVGHRSPPDPWGWGGPGAMRAAFLDAEAKLQNSDAVKEPAGVKEPLLGWLDFAREKKPGATWPWGESAAAWDGRHALVVWPRQHLVGEKLTNFENCDLVAARVDEYRSLDKTPWPVAASPADERRPALASDGAGHALCVYEKAGPDGVGRVAARLLTLP